MDCLQILAVVLFLHTISGYSVEKANTIQRQYVKRGGSFGTTCSYFNWRLCIPKKGKKDNGKKDEVSRMLAKRNEVQEILDEHRKMKKQLLDRVMSDREKKISDIEHVVDLILNM
ncbi:uncharacterized protein LOC130626050 [Hydractinia symbiolongicarpus]|uniref:uncharacterized protein LOC130626050 n=1 Tax=Hydractinia symbiolongicarpus TaxID=13093 RepID=UPI00254B406E|nr:uncharacterized protein LOC130626050 [Hydractinia symbiolongicarpus]